MWRLPAAAWPALKLPHRSDASQLAPRARCSTSSMLLAEQPGVPARSQCCALALLCLSASRARLALHRVCSA